MISHLDKIHLRNEYSRLLGSDSFADMIESHKMIAEVGFSIFYAHGKESTKTSVYDHDGNILFQMSILKCLSLQQLAHSINYKNSIDGVTLKDTYDPFGMYTIVRAQYEAFCNFNNIFIQSRSEDELKLKYHLWVLSGLNYRQRFKAKSEWAKKKKATEAIEIDNLNKSVLENPCYLQLDEQSQQNIQDCIKRKDWQIKIDGNRSYKIAWHEMMSNSGANENLDGQYSYLSLATHPSNVSVFQFSSMYIENQQGFNAKIALQLSRASTAMFVRDYVEYFKLTEKHFNNLPIMPQLLINGCNSLFRSEDYELNSINDILN
ncbi:MAG: hypothetical protein MUF75_02710 [Bacteroidia bacterium]|jgi:hypothetical protein|nr:hypothetical protein [Bacteroidia bacterium]